MKQSDNPVCRIAPSLLAANFLHLEEEVRLVNRCGDLLHLDVMDGTFVPNISFGFSVIDQLARVATVPMDAHLMVVHPERWFERLARDGVRMCSFHWEETGRNTARFIRQIQGLGMQAGVAVNPDVPVEKLYPYIGKADFFLVMSVFAGFGGQKFIYETLDRVARLRAAANRRGVPVRIEVDGGIKRDNVGAVRESGADIIVAGSAIFGAQDPAAAIAALREA